MKNVQTKILNLNGKGVHSYASKHFINHLRKIQYFAFKYYSKKLLF